MQQEVTAISSKLQLQAAVTEAEAEGDETTLARLLGVTAPGASDWLTTDPSCSVTVQHPVPDQQ